MISRCDTPAVSRVLQSERIESQCAEQKGLANASDVLTRSENYLPMSMDPRLYRIVAARPRPLVIVTVSVAHLYGFSSPDSESLNDLN